MRRSSGLVSGWAIRAWSSPTARSPVGGSNSRGELGDGTKVNRNAPRLVPGLEGVVQVVAGGYHTCVLSSDRTVRCWGLGGVLGDGTTTDRAAPTLVAGLTGVAEIGAYEGSTCARLLDGSVRCWGHNGNGQLGDGTDDTRSSPVPVLDVTNATSLAVGHNQACVSVADGSAKCWGYNYWASMGPGGAGAVSSPVNMSNVAEGRGRRRHLVREAQRRHHRLLGNGPLRAARQRAGNHPCEQPPTGGRARYHHGNSPRWNWRTLLRRPGRWDRTLVGLSRLVRRARIAIHARCASARRGHRRWNGLRASLPPLARRRHVLGDNSGGLLGDGTNSLSRTLRPLAW